MYITSGVLVAGMPVHLKCLQGKLEELTEEMLGPDEGQKREVRVLNRVLRWNNENGVEYEADPGHVQIMMNQLGLQEAKSAVAKGGAQQTTRPCQDIGIPPTW